MKKKEFFDIYDNLKKENETNLYDVLFTTDYSIEVQKDTNEIVGIK